MLNLTKATMAKENTFGVVPCSFKPGYTEKELENIHDGYNSSPIITTSEELSSCGLWQCKVMSTATECMGCRLCDSAIGNRLYNWTWLI